MTITRTDKLVSGLTHLLAAAGILHLIVNLIGMPLFPRHTLVLLVPNALLLIAGLLGSRLVLRHVLQANLLHLTGLAVSLIPWTMRVLAQYRLIPEKAYAFYHDGGTTASWSLSTVGLVIVGLVIFSGAIEASDRGFHGQEFRYPLVGKLVDRYLR